MISNLLCLAVVLFLTFTAKHNKVGIVITFYYAAYVALDFVAFGFSSNTNAANFYNAANWYLIMSTLTFIVLIWSLTLYMKGNDLAGLYAVWLIIGLFIDSLSTILMLEGANDLIVMYNEFQKVGVSIELILCFFGMDHAIKRNWYGARTFINYINRRFKSASNFLFLLHSTGAKCRKKK